MQAVAEKKGLELAVPPPKLCTDNGVMVAWAGIERMRLGLWEHLPAHAASPDEAEWVDVRPRWPLTDRYGSLVSLIWSLPYHRTRRSFLATLNEMLACYVWPLKGSFALTAAHLLRK